MAGKENVSGKALEKSNFSQTCRLLSQILKERRSLSGDFGFGMTPRTEAEDEASPPLETKNLLGSMEDMPGPNDGVSKVKQSDFWTNFADFSTSSGSKAINTGAKDVENSGVEKKGMSTGSATAPMTIFYGGRVFVFEDFPQDRLKDIAGLAADSGSKVRKMIISSEKPMCTGPAAMGEGILHARPDLPLATKASLHRFFAKRKDRVSSSAPYRVSPRSLGSPNSVESNISPVKPDLEANESSGHLELRL